VVCCAAAFLLGAPAQAADLEQVNGSLKQIPADAAFYSSMLRNREQIEAVSRSRAWAKLTSLPAWQMARAQLNQLPPQAAVALQLLQQPENQQLIKLLGDMVSEEVFFYGGASCDNFAELLGQVSGAVRYGPGPAFALLSGQQHGMDPEHLRVAIILQVLSEHTDSIKAPDFLIGFKLSNKAAAEVQLKRLEDLLNGVAEQIPLLKGRVKRQKSAGGDQLTLALDGSMVPWDRIPFKDYEEKGGQFDNLQKKLKKLKVTIGLAIRGDYLLFTVGETGDVLPANAPSQRLVDRPELKPLAAHADKRLTGISYVSKGLRTKFGTSPKDIDGLVELAKEFLKESDLTAEEKDALGKDMSNLAKDIKSLLPVPGALVAFSFLNGRGMEGFAYDFTKQAKDVGSKPLTLMNHLGGSPLVAIVGRAVGLLEKYQMVAKWVKIADHHVDEILVPRLDGDQKDKYEQIIKVVHPICERLDKVTRTLLLPALADGQCAFVLDGRLKSKQWFAAMPAAEKPLPMLEPALVFGVSDAALLRRASTEYRSILNELLVKIRELNPEFPEAEIPPPKTSELKSGTLYSYPIPEHLGLDKQILPNAGLSERIAALSISREHTERLLEKNPLKIDGGPLADPNRALVGAAYIRCEGIIDVLVSWVQFGIRLTPVQKQAGGEGDEQGAKPPWLGMLDQIPTALEVLKVFRTSTSAIYIEGDALVTHSETIVRDL